VVTWRIILGFSVSVLGGALFLWAVIEKAAWWYVKSKNRVQAKPPASLTVWLGIIERASFTFALMVGAPEWIAIWLAVKIAAVRREGPSHYNIFLIGNVLSIAFGVLGAYIALGHLPCFKR